MQTAIDRARVALEKTAYTDAQKQAIYDNAVQLPDVAVMCGVSLSDKQTPPHSSAVKDTNTT